METKYIAVEWPEYQYFMEHPSFRERCYFCPEASIYFIPEDLYDEVMNPPFKLPEEYRENFTTEFDRIKRGQKVLIDDIQKQELFVVEANTSWIDNSMPCILSCGYLPGVNCHIVAVEKEGI